VCVSPQSTPWVRRYLYGPNGGHRDDGSVFPRFAAVVGSVAVMAAVGGKMHACVRVRAVAVVWMEAKKRCVGITRRNRKARQGNNYYASVWASFQNKQLSTSRQNRSSLSLSSSSSSGTCCRPGNHTDEVRFVCRSIGRSEFGCDAMCGISVVLGCLSWGSTANSPKTLFRFVALRCVLDRSTEPRPGFVPGPFSTKCNAMQCHELLLATHPFLLLTTSLLGSRQKATSFLVIGHLLLNR